MQVKTKICSQGNLLGRPHRPRFYPGDRPPDSAIPGRPPLDPCDPLQRLRHDPVARHVVRDLEREFDPERVAARPAELVVMALPSKRPMQDLRA